MFDWIPEVCGELRTEMIDIYHTLLVPVTLLTVIFEFFKKELNFDEIAKRVILSFILLYAFEYIVDILTFISNGIIGRLDGISSINDLPGELKSLYKSDTPGFFKFRQMLIFALSQCSFLLAYLSFYLTDILAHFIYAILYVVSPLAFLCLIPKATMHIPKNIFKGIITVMVWKVLWSVLGAMILAFVKSPVHDWENFLVTVAINISIGVSMLAIPCSPRV